MRFRGQFRHIVDHKGRVAVPHPFRARLPEANGALVLAKGYDGEIEVHPLFEWEEFEEQVLLALPYHRRASRRFRRRRASSAWEVGIDNQGRITLPRALMDYAGIKDEVIITGAISYFEIWGPEAFERFEQEAEEHQEADSESLSQLLVESKKEEE
jgi:MraZ protein